MNEKIHISALHFEPSKSTQESIRRDLARLFHLQTPVARIDLALEGEYQNLNRISYHVALRAQLRDEVLFEMQKGGQLLPTVQAASEAMEHRLRTLSPASTL